MMVENGSAANLFYPSEKPHVVVKLRPMETEKGLYSLVWTVKDIDGKIVEQDTDDIALDAGKAADFVKNFKPAELGHYDYTVRLGKKGEKPFLHYDGSFALLAEDTRKAGYDSPYFSWNFRGAHGTPRDPEIFGTIFKRMGIRRA